MKVGLERRSWFSNRIYYIQSHAAAKTAFLSYEPLHWLLSHLHNKLSIDLESKGKPDKLARNDTSNPSGSYSTGKLGYYEVGRLVCDDPCPFVAATRKGFASLNHDDLFMTFKSGERGESSDHVAGD